MMKAQTAAHAKTRMSLPGQPFLMGIDGGQTSVKCALANLDGVILGQGQGRGLLHLAAPDGAERFVEAIGRAMQAAWEDAGLAKQPLSSLTMGLTGVTSAETPEAKLASELVRKLVTVEKIRIENDAVAALMGAHAGGPGIICIAGTGAITLGQDAHGRLERAGGWGWLLGDEGSAFWIGREALRAALRAQEGLGPPTSLLQAFQHHFQIDQMIQVKRVVFSAEFGAQGFAALAPMVQCAASEGDEVSGEILHQGGNELAAAVLAVARKLDFGGLPVPIAPVGGAFEHINDMRQAFADRLTASGGCQIVEPRFPPVMGAVFMARQLYLGEDPNWKST